MTPEATAGPCATEHEWKDQVDIGMPKAVVDEILDFPGVHDTTAPSRAGLHSFDWQCCPAWQPDKDCRGWFDNITGGLVDKNVVAR
jgi:hypothetical protein